jgi:ElaB/YqjD/DUF883 family membrane-anchored ribosome-binding protein
MTTSTASKVKKLKKTNNDVYHSLLTLKDTLAETLADKADGVKSRASEILTDLLENCQTKTSDYQNEIEEYVNDKPLKALGFAALFGFLLGKVVL